MAYTPCDLDHKMYSGRGTSFYPALLVGMDELRKKRKVCPRHWAEIKANLSAFAVPIVDGMDFPNGTELVCTRCKRPNAREDLAGLFVTVYENGSVREDWYGKICGGCYDNVAYNVLLAEQTAL